MNLNHTEKTVVKPWGEEIWRCLSKDFCVKTIKILKGYKTSFQWHREKEEINFIRAGEAEVWMENEKGEIEKHFMRAGDSFFVPATRKHRVIALTDIEMFEVSNEFVDDVVRINDEFGRGDGKIEAEHQTQAVLILAAGLGSRLKKFTAAKNKALVPIAGKAVISHIIEKYPENYEIVVAVGYKADSLIEYCKLAHSTRSFRFVVAENWDNPKTDPGHSVWCCKNLLQRPFYINAVDSIVEGEIPHIDGNWLGIYPTDCPEKYATVWVENDNITGILNKTQSGFDNAFIGVAAILDYSTFWRELESAPGHELVSAWKNEKAYNHLKGKTLRWFDAGNLDDLRTARESLCEVAANSPKDTEETFYKVGDRAIKFHPSPEHNRNWLERSKNLGKLAPKDPVATDHFVSYRWEQGKNLYHQDESVQVSFLNVLKDTFQKSARWNAMVTTPMFYEEKTAERNALFAKKYGEVYLKNSFIVNGVPMKSVEKTLESIDFFCFALNTMYSGFHGDLHLDNVIYNPTANTFTYIDWRDSFGGETKGGDIYYDLGKLYAGLIVPFELLKNDNSANLVEGSGYVNYSYPITPELVKFRRIYEKWIVDNGFSLTRAKLVAGIALLNISPLHTDKWNKILFFKGLELIHEAID